MDNFWGKKNDDNLAVVENDCNQTINTKKKQSNWTILQDYLYKF